jgi:hypothetical protein
MTYNEFLMANVIVAKSKLGKDIDLDELYPMAIDWHNDFIISEYDNQNTNLYQCMEAYIINREDK